MSQPMLSPEARTQRRLNRRSILDFITEDTRALHGNLGYDFYHQVPVTTIIGAAKPRAIR